MTTATTTFENQTGNWSYDGPFHLHIPAEDIEELKHNLAQYRGAYVDGTIVRVGENGGSSSQIKYENGLFGFSVGDEQFCMGFMHLVRICCPSGQLIWKNRHFQDVVMQKVKERPHGSWPMFYYDGQRIIGQIGSSGPWYQLDAGQEIRFGRHGRFRFTKAFKTLAYLDVTLPRKGWNPTKTQRCFKIPTGKLLLISRDEYYMEWMDPVVLREGFGYHPCCQPLNGEEVIAILQLLSIDTSEEWRMIEIIDLKTHNEVRKILKDLRFASWWKRRFFRREVEKIKSKMLT